MEARSGWQFPAKQSCCQWEAQSCSSPCSPPPTLPAHYWRIQVWDGFTFQGEVLPFGTEKATLTSHYTMLCTLPLLHSDCFGHRGHCQCKTCYLFVRSQRPGLGFLSPVLQIWWQPQQSLTVSFLRTHGCSGHIPQVFCPFPLSQYLKKNAWGNRTFGIRHRASVTSCKWKQHCHGCLLDLFCWYYTALGQSTSVWLQPGLG